MGEGLFVEPCRIDAEKGAEPGERLPPRLLSTQLLEFEDEDLRAREVLEIAGELRRIEAELEIEMRDRPALLGPRLIARQGLGESAVIGALAELHQIMRIGPLDRIAEQDDDPGLGRDLADPRRGLGAPEIGGARITAQRLPLRALVKGEILLAPRDETALGVAVFGGGADLGEEVRLLDGWEKHVRMAAEIFVKRGGARLGSTHDEEIGPKRRGHVAARSWKGRKRRGLEKGNEASPYEAHPSLREVNEI